MPFINYKNTKIHYTTSGTGRAIVLLHGFLENLEMWEAFRKNLSKTHRVICIDLPGHGKSESYGYVHSMEFMAEVVFSVLRTLLLRKIFIVGHSMGGYVSLAFLEKYESYVKGICLFHSNALPDSNEKLLQREKVINIIKHNPKLYIKEAIPTLFSKEFSDRNAEQIEMVKSWAFQMEKKSIVATIEGMKQRKSRIALLKHKPNLFSMIVGMKDESVPLEISFQHTQLVAKDNVLLLENSAHMGYLEEPEVCVKFLRRKIRKAFYYINSNLK